MNPKKAYTATIITTQSSSPLTPCKDSSKNWPRKGKKKEKTKRRRKGHPHLGYACVVGILHKHHNDIALVACKAPLGLAHGVQHQDPAVTVNAGRHTLVDGAVAAHAAVREDERAA